MCALCPVQASRQGILKFCLLGAFSPRASPGLAHDLSDPRAEGPQAYTSPVPGLGWARGYTLSAGFSPNERQKISVTSLAARSATRRERGRNWGATERLREHSRRVPVARSPCLCPPRPAAHLH